MTSYDGARARTLRLEARIGIEDLATAAGVSPNTVRSAESGHHQPRPRVADAIARALGVDLSELTPLKTVLTLRDARCRLGLSQAEMAARIGVVRQMVSQVERGVSGVRSPRTWAAAYGLTATQWAGAQKASRDLVRQKVAAQAHRRREQHLRGDST
ncbi:helix-turn-helix transcriptional regulator [Streptomyces avermitilis]|uniref:helix-turn-helix transcriptional regulator n=1 Tax=Streptomyces avermitilis TaxID=33903 RepID=UPI0033B7DECA